MLGTIVGLKQWGYRGTHLTITRDGGSGRFLCRKYCTTELRNGYSMGSHLFSCGVYPYQRTQNNCDLFSEIWSTYLSSTNSCSYTGLSTDFMVRLFPKQMYDVPSLPAGPAERVEIPDRCVAEVQPVGDTALPFEARTWTTVPPSDAA